MTASFFFADSGIDEVISHGAGILDNLRGQRGLLKVSETKLCQHHDR